MKRKCHLPRANERKNRRFFFAFLVLLLLLNCFQLRMRIKYVFFPAFRPRSIFSQNRRVAAHLVCVLIIFFFFARIILREKWDYAARNSQPYAIHHSRRFHFYSFIFNNMKKMRAHSSLAVTQPCGGLGKYRDVCELRIKYLFVPLLSERLEALIFFSALGAHSAHYEFHFSSLAWSNPLAGHKWINSP